MKLVSHFIWMSLILFGCGPAPLKPLADDLRHAVRFVQLTDLTGDYASISPSFDSLARTILSKDFVYTMKSVEARPQVFYTPNPFRLAHEHFTNSPEFEITGDVERITYEPASRFKEFHHDYTVFESLGSLFSGRYEMGASIEYRFVISHPVDGTPNDTIVVTGFSSGEKSITSRRQLMHEANNVAAWNFGSSLLKVLRDRYRWDLTDRVLYGGTKKQLPKMDPVLY